MIKVAIVPKFSALLLNDGHNSHDEAYEEPSVITLE